MGREVRRVKKNWSHPKDENGNYIPLFENSGELEIDMNNWLKEWDMWQKGLCRLYGDKNKEWEPIEDEFKNTSYTEYSGPIPSPDDYMPNWSEEEKTHYMMYETTSEGTPISPAFDNIEDLAKWLSDNKASSFGTNTATYEQWLSMCKQGYAPSMVLDGHGMRSGVEVISDIKD